MSYYVHRINENGRQGWTGPIRSEKQANKEAEAWKDAGQEATVYESSPEVKARVRAWDKNPKQPLYPQPTVACTICGGTNSHAIACPTRFATAA